jgi:hypothetical protein
MQPGSNHLDLQLFPVSALLLYRTVKLNSKKDQLELGSEINAASQYWDPAAKCLLYPPLLF